MSKQQTSSGQSGPVSAQAVVFREPGALELRELSLTPPGAGELLVDVEWTGISTGTEKLLYHGQMPSFPGMGYPLVPGYETVGRVADSGNSERFKTGDRVFVTGARCFGDIRGLFGGAASRLVVKEGKLVPVATQLNENAILFALAATAYHALHHGKELALPDLIVGHGVLGRLIARLTVALGARKPTVWETNTQRSTGALGYEVMDPAADESRDYGRIMDASGDPRILDTLIQRLARNGEVVLAGFYSDPLSFTFPPAFMREAQFRVVAEWLPDDLLSVKSLVDSGALDLDNLISHKLPASEAEQAYPVAFSDPDCLKMVLDWRNS
ncbi:MAG: chlorophyll synthesis pathway protein BchC [Pseudomonadota bacterium]